MKKTVNLKDYFKKYYIENKKHIRQQQETYRNLLDELYGGNYIYMFIPYVKQKLTSKNILYIGSTQNMYNRYFQHKNKMTDVSKQLDFLSIKYKIYFFDLQKITDRDFTRQELYKIEYYLIQKFKSVFNIKVGKEQHAVNPDKDKNLIEIAEQIKLKDFKLFNLEEFKAQKKAEQVQENEEGEEVQ